MHQIPPEPADNEKCRIGTFSSLNLEPTDLDSEKPEPTPLSEDEAKMLKELETVLETNGKASLAAAKALHIIETKRLYRGHTNSVKSYGARWGYSPSYTYRLVKSGAVYFRLEPLWREEGFPEPTSEWQLRPLAGIEDLAAQRAAWIEAVRRSQGNVPTASVIEVCLPKSGKPLSKQPARSSVIRIDLKKVDGLAKALLVEAQNRGLSLEESVLTVLAEYFEQERAVSDDYTQLALGGLLAAGFFRP